MSIRVLIKTIEERHNPTVAGLDPTLDMIPQFIRDKAFREYGKNLEGAAEAIWQFNKGLIDALADVVPAVKPQSAFYEMYGIPGLMALDKTITYAKQNGLYVILDVKRNDIGSTAAAYSTAYLGETDVAGEKFRATAPDGITINPYLGTDGIQPFVFDANLHQKTLFALVKTSNPSSGELQDLTTENGDKIYEAVAKMVANLSVQALSDCGYSALGAVVGATYPEQMEVLRKMMPYSYFLVPGYGAQGGTAKDAAKAFNNGILGAVVNSSRKIMYAYRNSEFSDKDYQSAARAEAVTMKNALTRALRA